MSDMPLSISESQPLRRDRSQTRQSQRAPYRGWSHFHLERARVGLCDELDTSALSEARSVRGFGPALAVLSCDPEIGWAVDAADLEALCDDPRAAAQMLEALIAHDDPIYERAWYDRAQSSSERGVQQAVRVFAEQGRPASAARRELVRARSELGRFLCEQLARYAARAPIRVSGSPAPVPTPSRLSVRAETAWVALAGRLGPTLRQHLSDGHPDGCLRVCELTAIVFRATR